MLKWYSVIITVITLLVLISEMTKKRDYKTLAISMLIELPILFYLITS